MTGEVRTPTRERARGFEPWTGEGGPGLALVEHQDQELPPDQERPDQELTRRELRKVHQEHAAPELDSEAQRECGRGVVPTQEVTLQRDPDTGSAWIWGLRRCGSSTACPECARRVAQGRSRELQEALERHLARGGGVLMLTVTIPHHAGLPSDLAYRVLAKGWSRFKASSTWKGAASRIGYVGTVTAHDCTHGPNGWHHHKHALVLTRAPLPEGQVEELEEELAERWADRIERAYRRADGELAWRRIDRRLPSGHQPLVGRPTLDQGLVLQRADRDAAGYVAHTGLMKEVTRVDAKKGRKGHRTPLQILQDFARYGRDRDLQLWIDYCRTMKGKPALVWSPGLRDELGADEQTVMDLAQPGPEDPETEPEDVVALTEGLWRALWSTGVDPGQELVALVERDQGATLRELQAWCNRQLASRDRRVELEKKHRMLALMEFDSHTGCWNRS